MNFLSEMYKKKKIIIGIIILIGVFLLSGCGNKGTSSNGKDTLYIGMTNTPDSFNPLFNPGIAGRFSIRFMYDTLLGMPEPNKFTPQLANSINTEDNQHFTITLNPNAKWTDGKPIIADDVIYTLNLIANPKVETTKGTYIKMLKGLDDKGKLLTGDTIPDLVAKDKHTVLFKTKTPIDPNYVKSMLGFEVYIVPKHVFEKIQPSEIANSEAATKPKVTSGAFKFVDYVTNDHIEYEANKEYYKGTPKLNKIFIRIMNGTSLVTELKSGNVQMAAGAGIGTVPVKDLDILKKDSKLVVKLAPSMSGQFLLANNEKFDVHFRRALTMAIDRKQIVDQLYKGASQMVPTMYTQASPVYDANLKDLPYDPVKAKQELAASAFDISKELVLQIPLGNTLREQTGDLVQQNLKAIGLNVKQQKLDFPAVLSNAKLGDYDLMLMGYVPTVEPEYSAYFIPGGGSNYSHTNDPELINMFLQAANITSMEQRKNAYFNIQKYMVDHQFVTVLDVPNDIIAQSKNLKGGIKDFWEGSLDDLYEWHFE